MAIVTSCKGGLGFAGFEFGTGLVVARRRHNTTAAAASSNINQKYGEGTASSAANNAGAVPE